MTRLIIILLSMMLLFSSGFGKLAEAGNKTEEYSWLLLLDKPNQAPMIDPEIAIHFNWPNDSIQLDARVTDDSNDDLVYEWTQLSGPGVVTFSNRFAEDTTAIFPVYGEIYVLQISVSDGELTSTEQVIVSFDFLAKYTNPEQKRVPVDGIYPNGQRMLFGWYSPKNNQFDRMKNAGFSTNGPHYHSDITGNYAYQLPLSIAAEMKNWYRLNIRNGRWWSEVVEAMKTPEGREGIEEDIVRHINRVLADPKVDNNIFAWYGTPEEIMGQDDIPINDQRAYTKYIHNIIKANDPKKRPYIVSERSDSSLGNMTNNQCYQDGVMRQNYHRNGRHGDSKDRHLMYRWILDEKAAADSNDNNPDCPTNNGRKRAIYSTLSSYLDPNDQLLWTEAWFRQANTYDIFAQLAAGAHGFNMWTWNATCCDPGVTKPIQEKIYLEVLGLISKSGLGQVFLWGDDREDVTLEITEGPKIYRYEHSNKWYTVSSIIMRNIQYGNSRYLLLINNTKETIKLKLSGIPSALRIVDMITGRIGSSTPIIPQLGVLMYKIEQN